MKGWTQIHQHSHGDNWGSEFWRRDAEEQPYIKAAIRIPAKLPSNNELVPSFKQMMVSRKYRLHMMIKIKRLRDKFLLQLRLALGAFRIDRAPMVRVRGTVFSYRTGYMGLDDDNFRGGAKWLFDKLRHVKLLHDDNRKWFCHGQHEQVLVGRDKKRAMTIIFLDYGVPPHGNDREFRTPFSAEEWWKEEKTWAPADKTEES